MSTTTTAVQEPRPVPHPPHSAAALPRHATPWRSAAPRLRPSQGPIGTAADGVPRNPGVALRPSRVPERGHIHHHPPAAFQAKLTLGQPGDQDERAAESVADAVMRMPDPDRSAAPQVARAQRTTSIVQDALHSSGQPLDTSARSFMEPRFGADFSSVRVHSGEQAAKSARTVKALAYTVGPDVVFGAGQYAPGSTAGRRLLAHELQHVLQNNTRKISCQASGSDAGAPTSEIKPGQSPDYVQEIIDAANKKIPDAPGGLGDFSEAFRILSRLSPSDLRTTLIELDKLGYLDLLLSNLGAAGVDQERLNAALTEVVDARVKPAPDSPGKQKADAHQAVDAFRKSAGGAAWPNLTLSVIADGLDERIDTPALISQSVLNACGPAAIAYMLASNNPVRFVQIVQELFGTGKASLGGEVLKTAAKLRQNTPPVNMAQVDWMLMSSMRDSQNAIFSYKGNASEDFSAITTPHDLTHWMRSILKCDNVTWRSAYVSGELAILRAAGIAASSGKSVALLIDAAMLDNKKKDGKVGIPDHWVVLKSSVVEVAEGDKVQFSVWTWGERAGRNLDLDKSVVLKTFYGAAICSP